MRNKIFNIIVVMISTAILLSFFIFSNGFKSLSKVLKGLDTNWTIMAVMCMLLFWLLEAVILHIITKTLYKTGNSFVKSLKYAMLGQFFSAITPFQSGCQPAQVYVMAENGIPAGTSGSILMIKFIIHQATLTFCSVLVLALKFNYFNSRIPNFLYFCVFGFVVNTLIILFAILFSVNRKVTGNIMAFLLKILNKVRLVKDAENTLITLENELMSFHDNSAFIAKHISMCIVASVLTFFQWVFYYAIPYCIYRSFGLNTADMFSMICAQVFLLMFMSFIPLPGAAGGAEGGFYMIFGKFFPSDTIIAAIFLWRIITYYSCIAAGSVFTLMVPNRKADG